MAKKILIVDDAVEMLQLIRVMLEQEGYQVISAENGKDGLTKARQERPVLIITDVLMPEMDGFVYFKELRKDPVTAPIPVLILTARGKMEDTFRAMGVNGFLVKPFNADQLLSEVEKRIGSVSKAHPAGSHLPPVLPQKEAVAMPIAGDQKRKESAVLPGSQKALLLGHAENVLSDIREQLKSLACSADICRDTPELLAHCAKDLPSLIILELKADGHVPIENLLQDIQVTLRGRPQEKKIRGEMPSIILYKEHQVEGGDSSVGADIADTDSLLAKCAEIGFTKYIGLYSPLTFKIKIREFLPGS